MYQSCAHFPPKGMFNINLEYVARACLANFREKFKGAPSKIRSEKVTYFY